MAKPDYEVQYIAEDPIPHSPLSVLRLFGTSEASIADFAGKLIAEVKEGRLDALKVALFTKTLEKIKERVDEALKGDYRSEALKYGEKPFEFAGATIHACDTKVEYDYSKCNHRHWNEAMQVIAEKNEERKALESLLKTLTGPAVLVLDGEAVEVKPPTVKRTGGIKITIK